MALSFLSLHRLLSSSLSLTPPPLLSLLPAISVTYMHARVSVFLRNLCNSQIVASRLTCDKSKTHHITITALHYLGICIASEIHTREHNFYHLVHL